MPFKVTFHWGETVTINGGQPEDSIVVDGVTTPFQWAYARCNIETAIELLVHYWGPNFYGDGEDDEQEAIDSADVEWVDEETGKDGA